METFDKSLIGFRVFHVHEYGRNRLQQLPGSLTPAEGAVQYTYDQRGQLVQVETHNGSSFQLQAKMVYDGRGSRLQAIAHASGSTITATYTLDPRSGLPLLVDNGTNVTMILYGQVAIGEYAVQTAEWHYYLGDAQLSVRQLMDESGIVTQAQTYGPYGVLLHQAGDGGGLFGYKGGQSTANGLWYFGDGYFDPNTGQFLSTNGNPLLPLAAAAMANPGGFLLGPVLFIHWRRRKGKKGVHPATFLLLGVLLAAGISGCGGGAVPTGVPGAPIIPPTGTSTPMPIVTMTEVSTPNSTTVVVTIVATPTLPDCPTPPPTPASELELDFASDPEERGQFSVNYYNEAVKKYGQNNILQTIIGMVYAAEFGDVRYSIPEFVLVEAMSRSLYQEFKVLSTGGATPTLQEPPQSCRGDLYCDDSTKILILWLSRIQGWYSAVSFADIDTKFSTDEEYFRNRASDIMAATDPTWKDGIDSNGERPYDWGNQLTTEETTLAEKQYSQGELGVMPNSPCSSFFGFYYVARSSGDYPWFVIRSFFQKYRTVVPDATSCSID